MSLIRNRLQRCGSLPDHNALPYHNSTEKIPTSARVCEFVLNLKKNSISLFLSVSGIKSHFVSLCLFFSWCYSFIKYLILFGMQHETENPEKPKIVLKKEENKTEQNFHSHPNCQIHRLKSRSSDAAKEHTRIRPPLFLSSGPSHWHKWD